MNSDAPGGVNFFLANAMWHWFALFLVSAGAASLTHGFFGVPLPSVVDVVLALQLLFLALWTVAIGLTLLEATLVTRDALVFVKSIVALTVCALLPFSSIAGFGAYGAGTGTDIAGATFVYVPLVLSYLRGLIILGLIPEQLQDPTVLGLIPIDDTPTQRSTSSGLIQVYLILTSLLISTLSALFFRNKRRARSTGWPNS